MEILMLFIGIISGGAAAWFFRKILFERDRGLSKEESARLNDRISGLQAEKMVCEERASILDKNLNEQRKGLEAERTRCLALEKEVSSKQCDLRNLNEKIETQRKDFENLQNRFAAEFKNMASAILEDNSKRFAEQNKAGLDSLLKPLGDKLKDFKETVEKNFLDETRERHNLKGEISKLYDLNRKMTDEAENLTNALKGESKVIGDWGEHILDVILEGSGLQKGVEYFEQESHDTDEGGRQRLDVKVLMPGKRHVVIDSKMSLAAYQRYYAAETAEEKGAELKKHAAAVRKHMESLSDKKYHHLANVNSPDFVLMFMGVEPAYMLALQQDPDLFNDALEKKVVIVGPTTLIASLKIIGTMWRQEHQNRNALEIARQAGTMYDKFVNFVKDLKDIGAGIQSLDKNYHEAMNKLSDGKGNLIKSAEKIKLLGAKASKTLPDQLLIAAETEEINSDE